MKLQDSKKKFQIELDKLSYGSIKTEIVILDKFYLAEDYHQKYLHKNPNGYCGLKGTGANYSSKKYFPKPNVKIICPPSECTKTHVKNDSFIYK